MGKRQRRRAGKQDEVPQAGVDYADAEGNVLTLRDSISRLSAHKLKGGVKGAGTIEDDWHRRMELIFERFVISWTISGLPMTGQQELLGRYRMADAQTQSWVRSTLAEHVRVHQPEIDPS